MPELPEVETVRRTIAPHVIGRRIVRVDVRERRLRRPIPRDLAARLVGRTVRDVARRAKYLLLDVGDGLRWVVHLGMSGRFCVGDPPPGLPHVHVVAELEGGVRLYFRDPRRFGLMLLSADDGDLGVLGVEPLGHEFTGELLWSLTRRHRRVTVKSLLMDGRLVAGVGNIYANEALFHAGIRPGRRSWRLTRADAERLAEAVRGVLERAIASRGSSLLDYRDADGNEGEFQASLFVYERAGEPCRRCGTPVKRVAIGGRGTFYCPRCQR
ncbi:MAG: bifunctional DNA-formamidopyrimidine glycosylase/DNA-(apurinic or apyrimidinic site) lyase [Thermodesulfobacteriota bacterium]